MNQNHRGIVGWIFGSGFEKPGNAAILSIFTFLMLIVIAFFRIDIKADAEVFYKLLTTMLGPVGLALGYLFGAKRSK